ncbi:thioredoxin domain-containing protein [Spongiactinospora sp. TRM90649]|uniref:thioredoxin family protein n=1 Tax=Spongiactinospora sp. TRM90649 TaxID=3031114 RepID=UPI0023F8D755|nr:thioredoxin domain-containing protein [Spongiactinospora sp. TRM90649]MDF5757997.1 thioredoxin domain-containing protein [Spongiactinospora sp. TRM90649]
MRKALTVIAALTAACLAQAVPAAATAVHHDQGRAASASTLAAPTIHITDDSFPADVLNASKPVLVNFCAEWSGVCRALRPELERVAAERDGRVIVGTLDIDQPDGVGLGDGRTDQFGEVEPLPVALRAAGPPGFMGAGRAVAPVC